jgi:hypothetical protein
VGVNDRELELAHGCWVVIIQQCLFDFLIERLLADASHEHAAGRFPGTKSRDFHLT